MGARAELIRFVASKVYWGGVPSIGVQVTTPERRLSQDNAMPDLLGGYAARQHSERGVCAAPYSLIAGGRALRPNPILLGNTALACNTAPAVVLDCARGAGWWQQPAPTPFIAFRASLVSKDGLKQYHRVCKPMPCAHGLWQPTGAQAKVPSLSAKQGYRDEPNQPHSGEDVALKAATVHFTGGPATHIGVARRGRKKQIKRRGFQK